MSCHWGCHVRTGQMIRTGPQLSQSRSTPASPACEKCKPGQAALRRNSFWLPNELPLFSISLRARSKNASCVHRGPAVGRGVCVGRWRSVRSDLGVPRQTSVACLVRWCQSGHLPSLGRLLRAQLRLWVVLVELERQEDAGVRRLHGEELPAWV